MTVIINGTVDFNPADAAVVLQQTADLMAQTRAQKGCRHYVWSLDPAVPGRVYVYENWQSVEDLAAHLSGHFYTLICWRVLASMKFLVQIFSSTESITKNQFTTRQALRERIFSPHKRTLNRSHYNDPRTTHSEN